MTDDKPPTSFLDHAEARKKSKPLEMVKESTDKTVVFLKPEAKDYIAFGVSRREEDTFYRLDIRYANGDCDAFLYADFDIKFRPSEGIIFDFRGDVPSIKLKGWNLKEGYQALCGHKVKYIQEWGEYYHEPTTEEEAVIEKITSAEPS